MSDTPLSDYDRTAFRQYIQNKYFAWRNGIEYCSNDIPVDDYMRLIYRQADVDWINNAKTFYITALSSHPTLNCTFGGLDDFAVTFTHSDSFIGIPTKARTNIKWASPALAHAIKAMHQFHHRQKLGMLFTARCLNTVRTVGHLVYLLPDLIEVMDSGWRYQSGSCISIKKKVDRLNGRERSSHELPNCMGLEHLIGVKDTDKNPKQFKHLRKQLMSDVVRGSFYSRRTETKGDQITSVKMTVMT
jgi:hypothetical protein